MVYGCCLIVGGWDHFSQGVSLQYILYIYIFIYTVLAPGGHEETPDVVNPSYAEAVADGARVPAQDDSHDCLLFKLIRF